MGDLDVLEHRGLEVWIEIVLIVAGIRETPIVIGMIPEARGILVALLLGMFQAIPLFLGKLGGVMVAFTLLLFLRLV